MVTIIYKGKEFNIDEDAVQRWSVQKALVFGTEQPKRFYEALDKLFCGRSDEYAEMLGDDSGEMLGLLEAASKAIGGSAAKN